MVMAGEGMGPFDGPVDVVRNVSKERATVASFQLLENTLNLRKRH
jgi:hypothetical protein